MRLTVRLPKVEPDRYDNPKECPKEDCNGHNFKLHGVEKKAIRDFRYQMVKSLRWKCLKCMRTFRVYPQGVSEAQQSDRLKALTVLMYTLGLSYGAVSDVVEALGCGVSKTTAYNNMQEAGEKAREHQRRHVKRGGKRTVIGADGTYVKVKGEQTGIEVVVDDESGELLGLDIIVTEKSDEVLGIIREIAEDVDADVIVSDDHGAYKEWGSPDLVDRELSEGHLLSLIEKLLIFIWAEIAQRRVEAMPVVERLNVVEHVGLGLVTSLIRAMVHQFALQRAEEAFHRRIVVPSPSAVHTGADTVVL